MTLMFILLGIGIVGIPIITLLFYELGFLGRYHKEI